MKTKMQLLAETLNATDLDTMEKMAIIAALEFASSCIRGKEGEECKAKAYEMGGAFCRKIVEFVPE